MRSSMGNPGPTSARTAASTSRAKRTRFSSEPPYSSWRWLNHGERNWLISQPWPACTMTIWNPARLARPAALAYAATMSAICSCVSALTGNPSGRTPSDGPYWHSSPFFFLSTMYVPAY